MHATHTSDTTTLEGPKRVHVSPVQDIFCVWHIIVWGHSLY